MTGELRTAWNNLDGYGLTRLVVLSAAPLLTLVLVANRGLDLIDVFLVLISAALAVVSWLMLLLAARRTESAAQSREQMLAQMDREIDALRIPLTKTKD